MHLPKLFLFSIVRTVKTLSDPQSELTNLGYNISRTATYYRIMPSRVNTIDGRRHVQIAPVKLLRPESSHSEPSVHRLVIIQEEN